VTGPIRRSISVSEIVPGRKTVGVAPDTSITSGPTGTTSDTTPTFAFTATEANSVFECRVDTGAWADCTSPWTTAALSDGAHSVSVRATDAEVVAFTDANATWAPDALRKLVRNLGDPRVAYVCGRLRLEAPDGSNKEGVYWRYELVTREGESRLGSVTAGNGAVYALRRSDYAEVDPRFGHDLSLPYLMVQRGRRAVYEPQALAFERPTPTNESEYRRKVRMFEHAWLIVLRGRMLRGQRPGYFLALLSHRHLRYASGLLHLILLGSSIALLGHGTVYAVFLGLQLGLLAAALAGVGIARYYVLITWATVVALWNYLRRGVPATWAPQREELA